jgi:5'-nucleotidase
MLIFFLQTLGNHEFDDKIAGVVPFLENMKAPFVVANIDDTEEPSIQGKYNKSVVIDRGGRKIGIVGYVLRTYNVSTYNLFRRWLHICANPHVYYCS